MIYRAYTVSWSGTIDEQWLFECKVWKDSVEIFCYKTLIDWFPIKSIKYTTNSNNSIWALEIYDDFFKLYFRWSWKPIIFEQYGNT